jgi:hypothetical protein
MHKSTHSTHRFVRRKSDGYKVHNKDGDTDGDGNGKDSVGFRNEISTDAYASLAAATRTRVCLFDASSYSDVRGT